MFDSYMQPSALNETITEIAGVDGFRIAPRFNPGSNLPTDFAVIIVRFCLGKILFIYIGH